MASPWKLLARLVSPRRQQRQEHGSTDDVKPEVLAIAKPTETATDNGLNAADRPADEKSVTHDQPDAVSTGSDNSEGVASQVQSTADIEHAGPVEAADPALPDEAAHDAQKPSPVGEGATRKRSRRGKKAETIEVVPQPSPGVPTVSDDAISLDEEIKLLRDQLTSKLQRQNAQLKRMLERFER